MGSIIHILEARLTTLMINHFACFMYFSQFLMVHNAAGLLSSGMASAKLGY